MLYLSGRKHQIEKMASKETEDKSIGKSSDKKSEGKIGQRVKRYSQVSATVAGVAAKVAGEKILGVKIEREKHAAQLLASLGNLKGPLMKVGQILATIPEALPPEYASALQNLQSNAPPMGWPFVKRRMKTELGADWETKFKSFGQQAAAAASPAGKEILDEFGCGRSRADAE